MRRTSESGGLTGDGVRVPSMRDGALQGEHRSWVRSTRFESIPNDVEAGGGGRQRWVPVPVPPTPAPALSVRWSEAKRALTRARNHRRAPLIREANTGG